MKPKIYSTVSLLLLTFIIISFSSCKKWRPENRIVGNWRLVEVQKRRLLDKETIYTGYENGIFTFNDNNSSSFIDPADTLTGSWRMRRVNGGYYNESGVWNDEDRIEFIIKLYDFIANRVVDWEFDRVDFRSSGDKLFAYIDAPSYSYRYDFRKQ